VHNVTDATHTGETSAKDLPATVTRDTPPNYYCRAPKRQIDVKGQPCKNRAGYKTDHPGAGRCFLHGGRNQVKHGQYANRRHQVVLGARLIDRVRARASLSGEEVAGLLEAMSAAARAVVRTRAMQTNVGAAWDTIELATGDSDPSA